MNGLELQLVILSSLLSAV